MLIEWSDKYLVHVAEIDEQHKTWIDLLNRMADAMIEAELQPGWDSSVKQVNALTALVEETRAYTEYHFSKEEKVMLQYGYPKYDQHRALHEQFRGMIASIADKAGQGDLPGLRDFLRKLSDWAKQHIMGTDQKLGKYLNAHCQAPCGK